MSAITEDRGNLKRPKSVTMGVQVLLASLAVGTISAAVQLFKIAVGPSMAIALVIVLAFFGLGFLLVWRIAAGNNWARIILLILVLFGTPLAIPGYLAALKVSVVSGSISIFINVLQLIGTYLLFTSGSRVWFRNRK